MISHALHDRLPRAGRRRAGRDVGEEKARELLAEAGFTSVDVHLLEHDLSTRTSWCP